MSKPKSRLVVASAAATLSAAAAFVALHNVQAQSENKSAPAAGQVAASEAAPGAVIAIDPATGKTRTPEPEEIIALSSTGRAKLEQRKSAPVTYVLKGGGVALVADPSMDCAMVAIKSQDGKVKTDCVVGQDTASAIVQGQQNQPVKEKLDEK